MTIKEIIAGLKFTVEMFLFDPTTGEKYTEPRNDMDKTTIDACKGAIELLEQEPKTVLYIGDGYADGYMVYDMAECPNCGYEYEDSDKDWGLPFCPNCGQNLNWESEE
jgi:rubrerythrin